MPHKNKSTTLTVYDIAKAAGVSPGTVSRSLNNRGYIKYETREKIKKVVDELEYIPNRAARTLKTKKTGLILLAIPDTANPFYVDMIEAVQDVVKHNNYSMVLYYTEGKKSDEIKVLKMMHEDFADGMILINFYFTEEHKKEIEKINCPLILSGICVSDIGGHEEDKFDYIGVDTEKGMYLATKHMIMQGHTDIGYIGGRKDFVVFNERYKGYTNALIDGNLEIKEQLVAWSEDYNESSGYEAGLYFLNIKQRPTAVCAANDMLAMGALRAFEEKMVKVPEEISLFGMDNIDMASRIKPRLSSVAIAQSQIGREAAELIFRRLASKETGPSKKVIFEPRLVIRESSVIYR